MKYIKTFDGCVGFVSGGEYIIYDCGSQRYEDVGSFEFIGDFYDVFVGDFVGFVDDVRFIRILRGGQLMLGGFVGDMNVIVMVGDDIKVTFGGDSWVICFSDYGGFCEVCAT